MKHFFRLMLWVEPGGSRKHEEWIAGTLEEIKVFLQGDLESGQGAYHALWYGEHMVLECWEGRRRVASLDLHPFIAIELEGIRWPLTPGSETAAEASEDDEEDPLADEALWERVLDDEVEIVAHVDWARVELPVLAGEPLGPGEAAVIQEGRHEPHSMAYGHHMLWG